MSNLSSMSGLSLDDERLSALGASSYHYDAQDNMLYIGDDSGNIIYQRGLETGNELFAGANKDVPGHLPDITEDDFTKVEGKLYDYTPTGFEKYETDTANNRMVVTANGKDANTPGDTIFVQGVSGKLSLNESKTDKEFFRSRKIPINDKNTKVIDSINGGSVAIYGRNKGTKKKVTQK